MAGSMQAGAGAVAGSYSLIGRQRDRRRETGLDMDFWNPKAHLPSVKHFLQKGRAYCNKAISPDPSQTVLLLVSKHSNLWAVVDILIQTTKTVRVSFDNEKEYIIYSKRYSVCIYKPLTIIIYYVPYMTV